MRARADAGGGLAVILRRALACAALMTAMPAQAETPIAFFNHAYVVVDAETADAIRTSPELREIGNLTVRETKTTTTSWFGRYLSGRETYLEFFAPTDLTPGKIVPVGTSGFALSGDSVGVLDQLVAALKAAGLKPEIEPVTKKFGARDVPWFTVASLPNPAITGANWPPKLPAIVPWFMEYVPSYLDEPEAAKEPSEGPGDVISRERYTSDAYAAKLIRDVTRLEIGIAEAAYTADVAPLLTAANILAARRPDGVSAEADGVTLAFTFVAAERAGLTRVDFALNREAPRRAFSVGRSTFRLNGDATATWTFSTGSRAKRNRDRN